MLNNIRQSHAAHPEIGLFIHSVDRLGRNLWLGAADAGQELGANVFCFEGSLIGEPYDEGQRNILYELVPPGKIDGLAFWAPTSINVIGHEQFTQFWHRFLPRQMVYMGGRLDAFTSIVTDYRLSMEQVTRHLIECHGCRRIAYIHAHHGEAPARYQGYVDALTAHGIAVDPALVVGHELRMGSELDGAVAMQELIDERKLSPPHAVDAVVACSDMLAMGTMKALQDRGFQIPQDVAVTGFDDHARASIVTPTLTTARQPFYEIGRKAVEQILAGLDGQETPPVLYVPSNLIVRESCGCVSPTVQTAVAIHTRLASSLSEAPSAETLAEEFLTGLQQQSPLSQADMPTLDTLRTIIRGFLTEVRSQSAGEFLTALRAAVSEYGHSERRLRSLQIGMSRLRERLLPFVENPSDTRRQAENLWQQARVMLAEAMERVQKIQIFEIGQEMRKVNNFGRTLLTTFDVSKLMEALMQGLPTLGIRRFVLSLYEDPQPYAYPDAPPEWSKVILAHDEHGQQSLLPEQSRFQTRHMMPEDLWPREHRACIMVESLHFLDQQIGFMLLEMGPRNGDLYSILRGQISSALQGALLVERVRANTAEIARQKYILDNFMESVPDRIYFKDLDSRYTRANNAHAKKLGLSDPAQEVDKTDFDFYPEEVARRTRNDEQQIIRTGNSLINKEVSEIQADGKIRWCLVTKMPLRDEHGEIIGTFGISRDITALKQAQAEIEQRTLELTVAYEEIQILNTQLQEENLRMTAELDVARRLQMMILPPAEELQQIKGLDIVGYMKPADEVGGDYYDVLKENGILHIGIGDVTGHGLESGVLMLMTQTVIRTLIEHGETDPVTFVNTLNRTIYKNVRRMRADKTLTFALINYQNGQVKIVGQHEELLVIRKNGQVERMDTIDLGFPIGLEEEISQWVATATISLQPGDGVVLYTDGITEAENENRQQYGLERLCDILSQHWNSSAEAIKEAVITDLMNFIGEHKVYDDITLVVLKQE